MTAPDDVRARFEAEFSKPPFEFPMRRWGDEGGWAGQYRVYHVQCAWEGYRAAHTDLSGEMRELVEKGQALVAIVRKQCGGYTSGPGFDALSAARDLDAALAKHTHQETK